MNIKLVGGALLAVVVSFGIGWVAGASGRSTIRQGQQQSELRALQLESRSLILEGRLALFLINFGDASGKFDAARTSVERLQTKLRESGQAERAGRLQIVLAHLSDAQRLAVALDQSAQGPADEAFKALTSLN